MNVGIDSMGVSFPASFLDLGVLARARGVEPDKLRLGLGTLEMGVASAEEDTVTLAVRAGRDALDGVDPSEIGMCVVGTETAIDHSKPVAAFVHGFLGLPPSCRIFETKHACYGGTAALQNALDWIRAGSARGKKALVICSDVARYGLETPGEPTQGAGAVALLVSESPRLLALDEETGIHARDVFDFWRPLYSKDAFVDGHYSVQCYLDALEGAYLRYRALRPGATPIASDEFDAIAYHVPYPKMAKKAHLRLRTLDGDPSPEASFERLVAPGLTLPSRIGNVYTASLYLSLASLLVTSPRDLDGRRVGLFSYGSGSCAEFFSGVVTPGAQARMRARGLVERVEARRALTLEEYEASMRSRDGMDQRPATEAPLGRELSFLGVRDHRRVYGENEPAGAR